MDFYHIFKRGYYHSLIRKLDLKGRGKSWSSFLSRGEIRKKPFSKILIRRIKVSSILHPYTFIILVMSSYCIPLRLTAFICFFKWRVRAMVLTPVCPAPGKMATIWYPSRTIFEINAHIKYHSSFQLNSWWTLCESLYQTLPRKPLCYGLNQNSDYTQLKWFLFLPHSHHTFIKEYDSFFLMWSKIICKVRIYHNIHNRETVFIERPLMIFVWSGHYKGILRKK